LFLVPGGRGGQAEITLYAKVMQHLPTDRAVWGLLADGLNDVSQPLPSSVATMAAVYIDRLRQVQTQGPYALAGECIGGVVAYEMAQQLQAQGQQVALLLLMDCWRPSGWRYWHYRLVQSPRQRWQTWRHWLKLAGSDWYKALVWRIQQRPPLRLWQSSRYGYLVLAAQAKLALAWWRSMTRPQLEDISAEELAARRVGSNYLQQTMRYRPRPCGAPLHVLMSEANVARGLAKDWQALARRGCHLWVAPGDHQTYLRETPEQAAILLTHCLDTAFSQATGD
jgi:thioesterase domain-containing protein